MDKMKTIEQRIAELNKFYLEYNQRDRNDGMEYLRRSHNMYSSIGEIFDVIKDLLASRNDTVEKLEQERQINDSVLETNQAIGKKLISIQAAAKSRDELIGKLVEALKLYGSTSYHSGERDDDGYTEAMIEDMEPNPELGAGLWSGKTAREALAEAKAQGYGE